MVNFLLGKQGGTPNILVFSVDWDSRATDQHWVEDLPAQEDLAAGDKNIIDEPLINRHRIVLPLLQIKLGLMKQFVKVLDKDGDLFQYRQNLS